MADQSRLFHLQIVAPDRFFYENDVEMVEARTTEGELGILKDHIPLTAVIAPGLLKIKEENGDVKIAALHSGFFEMFGDKMVILAEAIEWPEEIDENRAKEAKTRAERRILSSDENVDIMRAELALRRALVRLDAVSTMK